MNLNFRNTNGDNFLAAWQDFSEREKTKESLCDVKQQLEEAQKELEKSNRLKSAFLSNLSHEVRTPMNGILGFAELLKTPDLDIDEKDIYLNIIIQSTNRLLSVIDDILVVSKLETGQVQIQYSQVDLPALFEELRLSFAPFANETENELSFSLDSGLLDKSFQSDASKLKQVLHALIHNALKFTDSGLVKIGGIREGNWICFSVDDNGPGIAKEDLERVFLPFEKVPMQSYHSQNGLGLGLSVSRRLVELLGGRLMVQSSSGTGSLFQFRIPLKFQ
jgi:signal transduction histidine kinase